MELLWRGSAPDFTLALEFDVYGCVSPLNPRAVSGTRSGRSKSRQNELMYRASGM